MFLTVTELASYAHDEHGAVLTADGILTLLGSLVGIETTELLGMDEEHLAGQERLQLGICLADKILRAEHG